MPLRVTYFTGGARERVLDAVLAAGHHVDAVFVNDPARWPKVAPTIARACGLGLPVTVIRRKGDLADHLDRLRGALCLSAGFNYLFGEDFLGAVATCINVHGSLLPKYAGARTLSWAIEHGEAESGVTVHLVNGRVDGGAILLQQRFGLSPFETTRSLARRTAALEPSVVVEALALFEARGPAAAQPQGALPPQLPNRVPEHSRLDPGRPLSDLFDQIRAADPDHYPAHFYHRGEKVCIRLWRPNKPPGEEDLI